MSSRANKRRKTKAAKKMKAFQYAQVFLAVAVSALCIRHRNARRRFVKAWRAFIQDRLSQQSFAELILPPLEIERTNA